MAKARTLLSALAIAALTGLHPAGAFTLTDQGGINARPGVDLTDPDERAAHIANGAGPATSSTWTDRLISSSKSETTDLGSARPIPWSDKWFGPKIIIFSKDWAPPQQ